MKLQSSGPDWSLTSDLEFVTDALGEVWAELKHARLFMTGGTGFIGCWLLEALRQADRKLGLGVTRHGADAGSGRLPPQGPAPRKL